MNKRLMLIPADGDGHLVAGPVRADVPSGFPHELSVSPASGGLACPALTAGGLANMAGFSPTHYHRTA